MILSACIADLANRISKLSTENAHLRAVQAQIVFAGDIYRGLTHVSSDRNGLAAETLLRTLFEVIVSAIILAKHRDRLKDFVRHGRFIELRMMRVIQVEALKPKLESHVEATELEFTALQKEFGDQRWHKLKTTASFIEAEFQPEMYDRYYRRASAIAHGQPYVTVRDGKVEPRRAVWERLSVSATIMADMLMVLLLLVANREFKPTFGDELAHLQKEADAAAREDVEKIKRMAGISQEGDGL